MATRLAAATLLAGCVLLPACDAPAEVFDDVAQVTLQLQQARPGTGSRIRRSLVNFTIPASEPYERLTAAQKAALLAHFKDLPDGDEPAYPAEGLLPVARSIAFALADGPVAEGELFVTVHVDENGAAQSTTVYATPSARVSREAASALMSIKYKPGRCGGKPCSSEFPFTARFAAE